MAYNFSGTGDDLWATLSVKGSENNNASVYCGWFYPTTLTAGRCYWSHTSIARVEVHTTTSELKWVTDGATTDGVWLSSGAGISTNKWWFIAMYGLTRNTSNVMDGKLWIGDANTRPTKVTFSVSVAPSGNKTGSANLILGNAATGGTVGWQGDIGPFGYVSTDGNFGGPAHPLQLSALTSINQASEDFVYNHIVVPAWQGQWHTERNNSVNTAHILNTASYNGNANDVWVNYAAGVASAHYKDLSARNATLSAARCPRPDFPGLTQTVNRRRTIRR